MSRPYNSNERENRTMQKNITLIYGDCSSPEIVTQAVRVLDKILHLHPRLHGRRGHRQVR